MLVRDLGTLLRLLRGIPTLGTHAERLEAFYGPQASSYDQFREHLLKGRSELIAALDISPGARIVELGAGTGHNVEYYREKIPTLAEVTLVDLCPALLAETRRRTAHWPNVRAVEADATVLKLEGPVDRVYFSYALTMIPDWEAALINALDMLCPGGLLGVSDFYVSGASPTDGLVQHGAMARRFWPWWFRHDGVRLSPDHLAMLRSYLIPCFLKEDLARVPYLGGLKVPYYVFVGRKK